MVYKKYDYNNRNDDAIIVPSINVLNLQIKTAIYALGKNY